MKFSMSGVQQLGRALMLPIAVLPAAGLFLRLGQPDMFDIAFVAAAGQALFANLGLLFAIGVAVGFAKGGHGAAGLAGVVCYFVTVFGAKVFIDIPPDLLTDVPEAYTNLVTANLRESTISRISVPIGILSGVTAGMLYNRLAGISLPDYLAFFGGKRFVPIVSAVVGMVFAVIIGLGIDAINSGVTAFSEMIMNAGGLGLFAYGVLNRLLIVTGMHHILNNIAWFVVGDFNGATGDLNRFFAGDPDAGGFMAGFFPVMMFGLPAACYAMYRQARPERRKEVGGMLGSMALTSFLTGVTEPIEFTFMFLAPMLYLLHAVLTGISMALMDFLSVKLGFGFSAGLFDYVINFTAASNPLFLIPFGLAYGAIYYFLFSFAIRKFDLKTPGREIVSAEASGSTAVAKSGDESEAYILALGGRENLISVGACTTRLRLEINDPDKINETDLKLLGARGFVRPSAKTLQVIIGPKAELMADRMNERLGMDEMAPSTSAPKAAPGAQVLRTAKLPQELAAAFGGKSNISELLLAAGNRLIVRIKDASLLASDQIDSLPLHKVISGAGSDGLHHFLVNDEIMLGQIAALA